MGVVSSQMTPPHSIARGLCELEEIWCKPRVKALTFAFWATDTSDEGKNGVRVQFLRLSVELMPRCTRAVLVARHWALKWFEMPVETVSRKRVFKGKNNAAQAPNSALQNRHHHHHHLCSQKLLLSLRSGAHYLCGLPSSSLQEAGDQSLWAASTGQPASVESAEHPALFSARSAGELEQVNGSQAAFWVSKGSESVCECVCACVSVAQSQKLEIATTTLPALPVLYTSG